MTGGARRWRVVVAATIGAVVVALAGCDAGSDEPAPEAAPVAPAASIPTSDPAPERPHKADVAHEGPRWMQRGSERDLRRRAEVKARAAERREAARNPLAGRTWGVYQGPREPTTAPYQQATGATKAALARIALEPKAAWFGAWIPDAEIGQRVSEYIAGTQQGDPDALVQMTVFRMVPWEKEACRRNATPGEQASYRTWIDRFAAAVGDTPTAIVLQPDGPFSLCAPGGPAAPAGLIAYAARTLSALSQTSVYIEVGAADWPAAGQGGVDSVLRFLLPAGIEAARGIALNGTHYSSTELEIERGTAIVEALAARGITDKHFVVNTSGNGHPFPFGTYAGPDPLNANVCTSPGAGGTCITLGIPPTADVANPDWGLSEQARADAEAHADGYLWFGRPWLYRQNYPFQLDRALALVRSTPY